MVEDVWYRSERILQRPYRHSDAGRVLDMHSRIDVVRWLNNPPYRFMQDQAEAIAWIDRWNELRADEPPCGGWAIEPLARGEVAGTVLLVPLPNGDGKIQIGWHLHPDSTGHGYVTEAARAVLAYGFAQGLPEIWCDMFPDNLPSAAVAIRLGLTDLGVIDDPWYGDQSRIFRVRAEDHRRAVEEQTAQRG